MHGCVFCSVVHSLTAAGRSVKASKEVMLLELCSPHKGNGASLLDEGQLN